MWQPNNASTSRNQGLILLPSLIPFSSILSFSFVLH